MAHVDLTSARAYVIAAIEGFEDDPADSDFQRGYLRALQTIAKEALGLHLPHAVPFKETPQPSPVATRAETEAAPELVAEAQGHPSLCLMCGQNRIVV